MTFVLNADTQTMHSDLAHFPCTLPTGMSCWECIDTTWKNDACASAVLLMRADPTQTAEDEPDPVVVLKIWADYPDEDAREGSTGHRWTVCWGEVERNPVKADWLDCVEQTALDVVILATNSEPELLDTLKMIHEDGVHPLDISSKAREDYLDQMFRRKDGTTLSHGDERGGVHWRFVVEDGTPAWMTGDAPACTLTTVCEPTGPRRTGAIVSLTSHAADGHPVWAAAHHFPLTGDEERDWEYYLSMVSNSMKQAVAAAVARNRGPVTDEQVRDEALCAFWKVVAELTPEASTGDCEDDLAVDALRAIGHWRDANVPGRMARIDVRPYTVTEIRTITETRTYTCEAPDDEAAENLVREGGLCADSIDQDEHSDIQYHVACKAF